MKHLITFMLFLSSATALAERKFACNAVDSIDRKSLFELSIDTGVIKVKSLEIKDADWRTLYSENLSCGKKVPASYVCNRNLEHNLEDPNKKYPAVIDSIRCFRKNGIPELEFNGKLEVNRQGDGVGVFVCGSLSRNDLTLEDCKLVE